MKPIHRTQQPDGSEVFWREVDFVIEAEPWAVYRLLDGGRMKLRATAFSMFQQVDAEGKPVIDNFGHPRVNIQSSNQVAYSDE